MKTYCMFRETFMSPIFESYYDYSTGLIDGIGEDKFRCELDSYFSDKSSMPPNFVIPCNKAEYIRALQMVNGLVAFKYYDVGITVVTSKDVYVYLYKIGSLVRHTTNIIGTLNAFDYPKNCIGVYMTRVKQLDIQENYSILYADLNGDYFTTKGIVKSGITKDCYDDLGKINLIQTFKNGHTGCYIDNEGFKKLF